jgi:hypothetical protein
MHKMKEGVILSILAKESLNLELWLKSYEGLMFQGLFYKFPKKIRKLDFLELFLDGKIRGLGSRGCGPRQPSPPWTSGHCQVPEVIGARPPVAPMAGVAGRGSEEGKWSTGVPVPSSLGLERWRSGIASVVKAVAGRTPV